MMLKTVEFKHTRVESQAAEAYDLDHPGRSFISLRDELFDARLTVTDYGVVVSLFNGEQENFLIFSSMQSGRSEITTVQVKVDGLTETEHHKILTSELEDHIIRWFKSVPCQVLPEMLKLYPQWFEYFENLR